MQRRVEPGFSGSSFQRVLRSGASVNATAAQFATGFDQAALTRGRNRRFGSSVGQRDRVNGFDFIAIPGAASTQDAKVRKEFDVGIVVGRAGVSRSLNGVEVHRFDGFAECSQLIIVGGFNR